MKLLRIFIFVISLLAPSAGFACWDDEDDDWIYGSSWVDESDIYWDETLPEIIITPDEPDDDWPPDDGWPPNDDWWDDNGETDDEYENTDDVEDSFPSQGQPSGGNTTNNDVSIGKGKDYKKYTITDKDKIIIKDPKNKLWIKQSSPMSCVVTAMEYASQILKNNDLNYRLTFENDYTIRINPLNDNMALNGVYTSDLDNFINFEFNAEIVVSQSMFDYSLDNGWPILNIVSSDPDVPWNTIRHMIVIVGKTYDDNYYIYVDPADGNYKTMSYFSITGKSYSIKSLKRY